MNTSKETKKDEKKQSGSNSRVKEMQEREFQQRQKREHDIEHERQVQDDTLSVD